MKSEINESALLEGLAANDKKSVETIYQQNYNMVQSLIINNNGSPDDAKDIFQEAMIVLYEKATSGTFELTCQIKTYLYSVCRRLWLKRLQQAQRYYLSEANFDEIVPLEDELEKHDKVTADLIVMDNALNKIGEPCKSLLEAYYIQKKSMPEIAEFFGYTNADNAKTQKYKCLVRLKKIFFSQYKNEE